MAPKYEFIYFPVHGRGSMILFLLQDQGIEYKYSLVDHTNWAQLKPTTPFGQLPVLTVDGSTKLSQSHTIFRYLAREQGLMGSNNLEAAQIDMYIDQCADVRNNCFTMLYKNYAAGKQPFIDSIPSELAPFEKALEQSKDKQFFFGKLTAADYTVFDLLLVLDALSPGCLSKTPNVAAFFKSFGARPKLRAYLDQPETKAMKFTGSGNL